MEWLWTKMFVLAPVDRHLNTGARTGLAEECAQLWLKNVWQSCMRSDREGELGELPAVSMAFSRSDRRTAASIRKTTNLQEDSTNGYHAHPCACKFLTSFPPSTFGASQWPGLSLKFGQNLLPPHYLSALSHCFGLLWPLVSHILRDFCLLDSSSSCTVSKLSFALKHVIWGMYWLYRCKSASLSGCLWLKLLWEAKVPGRDDISALFSRYVRWNVAWCC